jgi:hypothetical protein
LPRGRSLICPYLSCVFTVPSLLSTRGSQEPRVHACASGLVQSYLACDSGDGACALPQVGQGPSLSGLSHFHDPLRKLGQKERVCGCCSCHLVHSPFFYTMGASSILGSDSSCQGCVCPNPQGPGVTHGGVTHGGASVQNMQIFMPGARNQGSV